MRVGKIVKGAVFNGFEQFVTERFGLSQWQQLLDKSNFTTAGIYLASDFYDDNELVTLITLLCQAQHIELPEALRDFGYYFFDILYRKIPPAPADQTLFDFLRSVDKVIHVQVKKTDPQAYTPALFYDSPDDKTILLRYVSQRKLCFFAEGLILGAAQTFNTPVDVTQTSCQHQGDKDCIIKVELCQQN
ncbi:guanylate cyclase [Thalassotalea marina]|uniref:Guanylate cyclase n=1 Tax=Thalassotalea marina TaxID=1673741 RepID=A0A919BQI6_9GAMM|nr:guanylate cyclase [Thalassotalea marina]